MGSLKDLKEVKLETLRPYANNAKMHGEIQLEALKKSIQEFGFINPVLIDKNNNIIAGHGRVMAAKELGLETVPAVYIEGLTEAQRRAYIIADNRLGELGTWDLDILHGELQALSEMDFDIDLTGFSLDLETPEENDHETRGMHIAQTIEGESSREEIECPNCGFKFEI